MKLQYDIEYKLDNQDNDDEYIEGLPTLKEARNEANKLIKQYGNRLVKLDIKGFDLSNNYCLEKHITII